MPTAEDLLTPYLAGETPRENGDIDAHCPMHHDNRRSAVINFEEGVWYCNTEGIGGTLADLLEDRDGWVPPPDGAVNGNGHAKKRTRPPEELPSEASVAGWKAALLADPIALDDLKAARGIWTKTVDYFELGWDKGAQSYTLPVRDEDGELVNLRRYQIRPPEGRRKIWGITGHNQPRLFPLSALAKARANNEPIIICEGELDAIVCNQYNFRAITRTAAAGVWKAEWSKLFEGMTVYVAHDCDLTGQDANRKVARAVARFADEVRVVRLPYPVTDKGGRDLTDWWLDHDADRDAFRHLLEDAQPFDEASAEDPEDVDPSAAAVVDAFDSRRAGKPLALTVTVKGRRDPGYSIPRKVAFRCTRDMGKLCEVCPMKAAEGGIDRTISSSDPATLEMVEATKPQIQTALRTAQGIPKCPKLNIRIAEHQAVEVLYARPSVDHQGGTDEAAQSHDYKSIELTRVGGHDTSPSQTVRVVGALHPDPRKQLNKFLVWDVSRMETSLDRFEMDSATFEMLKTFRPEPGQKPLKKLREIADDLAAHVTHIYGRPELHAAMDLVFHSAIGFDFDGKRVGRGWLELLVVGDTRTGKSEVATRLTRWYSAGEVVSCESASLAGVVGGMQQFGANKEWSITWGAIPINDRRLVVLDEISGLSEEDIAKMSSIRSSGVAELTKIGGHEATHARTRLIWLGNPRGGRMADYTYGVQSIRPLIGNPEDIARFDLAMSVSSEDVSSSEINRSHASGAQQYGRDACAALLRWVWSRTPEQVVWEDGAVEAVYTAAEGLGKRYVEDPPLVQAANVREKVARLAVAVAARTFSTDARGDSIVVERRHVRSAVAFIDQLYGMDQFGYAERSREVIEDRKLAVSKIAVTRKYLKAKPGLGKFLRSQGKFRRQDLEEILNTDREEANTIISQLYDLKMVYKDKGDVRLTPTLHKILREGTD